MNGNLDMHFKIKDKVTIGFSVAGAPSPPAPPPTISPIGTLTPILTGVTAGIGILNILPDDPEPAPDPAPDPTPDPDPEPAYDKTKIALVLLDEDLEPTDSVDYVETIDAVKTYLGNHAGNHYLVHFGDDCGISSIPTNSMQSLSNMAKLYVGTSVTEIGTAAFRYCSNLREAVFHCGNNAQIGNSYMSPFDSCTSLKTLYLSGGEGSTVGYNYGLNALETVVIGPGIVSVIGFRNCNSLQNIVLGNDLITIKGSAFSGDTALRSITIPSNVETIGNYAFYQCDSLTSITIHKAQGSISGAPWGAANATVTWTG